MAKESTLRFANVLMNFLQRDPQAKLGDIQEELSRLEDELAIQIGKHGSETTVEDFFRRMPIDDSLRKRLTD